MKATPGQSAAIGLDTMIPDLLRRLPRLRTVLDRYGLHCCGGLYGPAETIGYFARAHGVDGSRLVRELNAAAADPPSFSAEPAAAEPEWLRTLTDSIYRRFFKAGVAVVLTAGALWGAWLLLRIGAGRNFAAVTIHEINAHGHAQIFGWVGLFVMGFAYQAFPRMRHTRLPRPDLANLSFYLMVFGVFARALAEPLFARPMFRELAVAAGLAEIMAISIFIVLIWRVLRDSGKPLERSDAFILASLVFFIVQAVGDTALLYATTAAPGRDALLGIVATWQAPLRDAQIHGFAMLMILGVGLRMFPALFGVESPSPRRTWACFVLLLTGIIGAMASHVAMRLAADPRWAVPRYASLLLVAGASIALTIRWGLWARPSERDRSIKFVRAAVLWLHVSMLLLALSPLYVRVVLPAAGVLSAGGQEAAAIGFSHAYYGSIRHAITVGFVSLMILGMAAKVVPTLNGVDLRRLRGLWTPFVLVNLGCFLRVMFQIGTDFAAWAYPVAGASGLLEVAGIAVWGVHVWRIMNGWRPAEETGADRPTEITAHHTIGSIVEQHPATLPLLLSKGFAPLANPVFRRTMARAVTVRTAAAHHGLDLEELLGELRAAAFGASAPSPAGRGRGVSLPVLTGAGPARSPAQPRLTTGPDNVYPEIEVEI
jgi:hypothetical protein